MINIIQGEQQPYLIRLRDEFGDPIDLTGLTAISVCFQSGSTKVTHTLALTTVAVSGDVLLGKLAGTLTVAETDSLPKTTNGDIEVLLTSPGLGTKKTQITNAFSVAKKICD